MSERLLHEERKSVGRAAAMETDFLARVAQLRDELHIRSAQGGTRDRQRIALAVEDAFLRTIEAHDPRGSHGPPRPDAGVAGVRGSGEPRPRVRFAARGRAVRRAGEGQERDPVRQSSRPAGWDGTICALVRRVVEVLTKGGGDGDREEPGGVHLVRSN